METGYFLAVHCPRKAHTDDMSSPQLKDSGKDGRSLDSDDALSSDAERESGTGVRFWNRYASWRKPSTLLGCLGILVAFLVFLFGDNVTSRIGRAEGPSDGRGYDTSSLQPANGESRFHATYSFKKAPFVHPKIVGDLVGSLADAGDQVVAINLLDSQDSNRYFGDIFVTPQTDPLVPSWPWVYTVDGEPSGDEELATLRRRLLGDFWGQVWGQEVYAYRYLGTTQSGLDVLHQQYSGGGSGVFNRLVFVRIEADYGVEYPLLSDIDSQRGAVGPEFRHRELIRMVGRIPLGDRWQGTVEVVGDEVVVRGRDLDERCEVGGVSIIEAMEMDHFMDIDCKEGEPDDPPPARVYKAPVQR